MNVDFPRFTGRLFPEHTWRYFLGLERLGDDDVSFREIGTKFVMFAEEWAEWHQSACPEEEALPGDFATAGHIQTLCIIRVLRPDRITFALRKFVSEFLGNNFVSQPSFSMQSVYEDSSASTPILFLLFPGVDPNPWVEGLGREMGITTDNELLSNTSMGKEQRSRRSDQRMTCDQLTARIVHNRMDDGRPMHFLCTIQYPPLLSPALSHSGLIVLIVLTLTGRPRTGTEGGAHDREVSAEGRMGDATERTPHAVLVIYIGCDA